MKKNKLTPAELVEAVNALSPDEQRQFMVQLGFDGEVCKLMREMLDFLMSLYVQYSDVANKHAKFSTKPRKKEERDTIWFNLKRAGVAPKKIASDWNGFEERKVTAAMVRVACNREKKRRERLDVLQKSANASGRSP